MNEAEINKAFDEEYIKYRDAFPKDYPLPKPWVDLTDREMMDVIDIDDSPMTMGRKIEAKLKEKNGM
jgi:hypothetical protein